MKNRLKLKKEIEKCISSPYYFYTNYFLINGEKATTRLSEEEFNEQFEQLKNNKNLILSKNRRRI